MADLSVLGVGTSVTGDGVHREFAAASRPIADALASTLGPWGAYKVVAESGYGDPIVTRDPVRALRPLELDHPIRRLCYGVAADQRRSHGDGAVTATILCCALLDRCGALVTERGLHPREVEAGLDVAEAVIRDELDALARPYDVSIEDPRFRDVIETLVASRFLDRREHFGEIVRETVERLRADGRPTEAGGLALDVDDRVHVFARKGGSRADTQRYDGVLVKKEVLNEDVRRVEDARVAAVDQKLYLETETGEAEEAKSFGARVESPAELAAFRGAEDVYHREFLEPLLDVGVAAVLTRKGVDDRISAELRRRGILVVRRAKPESILESVAAATGGTVVTDVREMSEADLGTAGVVEEVRFGDLAYTRVGDCEAAGAVSVLTRGGTWLGAEEVEQSLEAVFDVIATAAREPAFVPGGGATEVALARRLRDRANREGSTAALAVEAVAEACEAVVATLAHNCGLDVIDALVDLRRAPGERGVVVDGTVSTGDVREAGVLDPLPVRRSALLTALAGAGHALTVDQVVYADGAEP